MGSVMGAGSRRRKRTLPDVGPGMALGVCLAVGIASPARADEQTVKLIQLLIQKGILTSGQAGDLLRESGEPVRGRRGRTAPSAATQAAPGQSAASGSVASGSVASGSVAGESAPAAKPGEIRVTYVPQFVRKQIADEVRSEVLTQTQQEGWAAPNALPEWTRRFKLYGDLRVRYERDSFAQGNYNKFVNFQNINNGNPFDVESFAAGTAANPPFLDTTQDRDRERVRARIGVQALIDDGLTADVRISTGSDQGPVTPNQTQGQPGDFSKYAVYIDRANFAYSGVPGLTLYAGRENNPFFTTDLLFYNELGFDGIAGSYGHAVAPGASAFISGGVFPILNSVFDFSTNSQTKFGSANAYMLAVQGGAAWQARPDLAAKLAVGFFDFNGVQGAVSRPCAQQPGSAYYCSTDDTRFPFQQFGNTVYAIRNIVPFAGGAPGAAVPNPQYYGLASRFAVLEVHPRIDITSYHPFDIEIEGEFLKNLAYNRTAILAHGPSNGPVGPQNNIGSNGQYQGGDTGYILRAEVGSLEIQKRWDWNVMLAYKYEQTDATLDSINDADFHLGGTNARGYILTGNLGIARDTFLSLRWFSAQSISGPKDDNNVLQLDLQSAF